MRPLAAELPLWQIDICNLREAVTQRPPDGERGGGTQSIKHGLFRNNHSDVGAQNSFEAVLAQGFKVLNYAGGSGGGKQSRTTHTAVGAAQVLFRFFS